VFDFLPPGVITVIQFPVTTGTFIAIFVEVFRVLFGLRPSVESQG
jgi:hypothetical protein